MDKAPSRPGAGRAALGGLFFCSGAAGLACQASWTRMLAAGLGHEMPSVLAVVAGIFGGFALGAWLSGVVLPRSRRPGRWYGYLELGIGLWGMTTAWLVPPANHAVLHLTGLEPSGFRQWLVAFIVPGAVLLPATIAMGATFPAIVELARAYYGQSRYIGALYAANTAGAVLGILGSTFLLLPSLGLADSLLVSSGVSLLCGLGALALEVRRPSTPAPALPASPRLQRSGAVAVALFLTGLLGIGYEVLGVRVLAQVLESTVYTYAAVLAVFLIGTAAGAALYQAGTRRGTRRFATAWLALALSICSLAGVGLLTLADPAYEYARARLPHSLAGLCAADVLAASLVFALPTVVMGATFTHLVELARIGTLGVSRAVAANTLGSALAPLVFGVLLLPHLGAKWSFAALALSYLPLASGLRGARVWTLAVPLVLVLALPAQIRFLSIPARGKLLEYRGGIMDSVAVVEHFDRHRSLLVNNRFTMGGTGAALAERRHGTIPLLLHPHPKSALFLGLGTGITFSSARYFEGLRADGVELVPEIVEVRHWFEPENTLPPEPDRFRIRVADARRFARVSDSLYDVIVADLFHPARDGAGMLYSVEHFQALRNRLAPGGICCQWLPLHQLDALSLRAIVRTFLEVFPDARAFLLRFNVDTPVLGLVGCLEKRLYGPDYFAQRVRDPDLAGQLNAEQLRDGFHLLGCFLAGPDALRRFARNAPLNTDDHPVVVFSAPQFNAKDETPYGRLLTLLKECPSDLRALVPSGPGSADLFREQLANFVKARNVYLRGLIAETEGRQSQAVDDYVESTRLSPHFTTGYAQCLTLAMQQSKTDPAGARRLLERLALAQPDRPVARQLLDRLPP